MLQIQEKLEQTIYGYDPNQFMPVFEDGELANRSAFVAYKLKRSMQHVGRFAANTVMLTAEVADSINRGREVAS